MPAGRPSKYSLKLAEEICETVASHGVALAKLCKQHDHWPHPDTIHLWFRKHPEFSAMYAKAKKEQVNALVEDILNISDDSSQDDIENAKGEIVCNSEWIARSRLRVDTRKWIAAKLVPRLYGDNALARELADEMEEFKLFLESKKLRKLENGDIDDSEKK